MNSSSVRVRSHRDRTRAWRRLPVVTLVGVLAFAGSMLPAAADNVLPVNPKLCVGTGALYVSRVGTSYNWQLSGSGPCEELFPVDSSNPSIGLPVGAIESVTFQGTGTSKTLGLCSGKPVVRDLVINVTAVFHSLLTDTDTTVHQTWTAPITTFPVATAFVISGAQVPLGAGVISTRTFLGCGNAGAQPSAVFTWAEMLPPALS